jgi:hypothetical protein
MRHLAVPTADGFLSTGDVEQAREIVAGMDFFETAFGAGGDDQADLHCTEAERLHLLLPGLA